MPNKFVREKKLKKPVTPASSGPADVLVEPPSGPDALKQLVVQLVREAVKKPVHIAVLSVAYKAKTGRSMKKDYKGGMLKYVRECCADEFVLMGEGNDTFLRLATPAARTMQWVRTCVLEGGPILVSMIGRLFHEAHGRHFNEDFPEGINRFLRNRFEQEFIFEEVKGQEVLVDLKRRGDTRFFVAGSQRRKGAAADAATAAESAATSGRLGGTEGGAPYSCAERLLVVGEADFSWSASLLPPSAEAMAGKAEAKAGKGASKRAAASLTTTSYDSLPELQRKYDGVPARVATLQKAGTTVLHGVDAAALASTEAVARRAPYDVIAFHFPHVGTDAGLSASIAANQELVRAFLGQARHLLAPEGEAHITLVHRYPYTLWLGDLARGGSEALASSGLEYAGSAPFDFGAYPGYNHQATTAVDSGALSVATRCLTHAWRLSEAPAARAADADGPASPPAEAEEAGARKRRKRANKGAARAARRLAAGIGGVASAPTAAAAGDGQQQASAAAVSDGDKASGGGGEEVPKKKQKRPAAAAAAAVEPTREVGQTPKRRKLRSTRV